RPVFGLPCQTANLWRIKILAQWCRSRHDEPPGFAMLNLTRLHLGIAHESQFQGLGISHWGLAAHATMALVVIVLLALTSAGLEVFLSGDESLSALEAVMAISGSTKPGPAK